jgi:hypothetical protein
MKHLYDLTLLLYFEKHNFFFFFKLHDECLIDFYRQVMHVMILKLTHSLSMNIFPVILD